MLANAQVEVGEVKSVCHADAVLCLGQMNDSKEPTE